MSVEKIEEDADTGNAVAAARRRWWSRRHRRRWEIPGAEALRFDILTFDCKISLFFSACLLLAFPFMSLLYLIASIRIFEAWRNRILYGDRLYIVLDVERVIGFVIVVQLHCMKLALNTIVLK